jgi:hypothetical protein
MFKRAWADYEDDEELPPLPWILTVTKTKILPKPTNNKFWLLDLEEESEDKFCIRCETGADAACAHTCCN